MILRRASENIRKENWVGVAIEFVLVVLGVFFGILAANWNEERLARRETAELLSQLNGELGAFQNFLDNFPPYYATVRSYAGRAQRGWRGDPEVDDRTFVIAAYQASQINGVGNNGAVWSAIFGADRLREIDDAVLRQLLARVMTFDYTVVDLRFVSSRYREEVRTVIPDAIQRAIRERCGDRQGRLGFTLPETCDLALEPELARQAASALRARPDLARDLNRHLALIDNQLGNIATLRSVVDPLRARLQASGAVQQ
ncbi:hypothetical protein [Sphingomonas mesophila]|uniref:hypothetical protein n=1 Tax=Sphingomonas mesophila TaxID=2303576 RepID=UPI000E56A208|nr:hypothetical protein [Sphingomonas mesophila]